jgi:hypothetical protein
MYESGRVIEDFTEDASIVYMKYKKVLTVSPRDFVVFQRAL